MTRARGLLSVALAATVSLVACGDSAGGDGATASPSGVGGMDHGTSVSPAAERPSTEATLRIESPSDGEVIRGEVRLVVELDGARVVEQTSTDLQPDQGHIHVVLDDQLVSMTAGLEQTLADVEPGAHLLKIEFVANDHAPFDPRVIEAVAFEVEAP